ncbi:MAG: hypothetical protein B7X12_01640 [Halothiobacillus sp. 20-53-49]|jgi:hypothetical protein|nr:DUF1840 domain-containing protein [Halothiobacillaceae bacterium]OYV47244.1 MAG: hypothetical protein B7X12_01640 [Halothiobacillus sp. 20-53-49]HUM98906.1 DUF1840 domain-containing protein [Halothiobacillus sp.]
MLITFSSKAYANISMHQADAFHLLSLMGLPPERSGSLLAAEVPAVLNRLKAAIDAAPAQSPPAGDDAFVSAKTRAAPLMDALAAAVNANCNVTWTEATILD